MALYPDYRPGGTRKSWEHTSMDEASSGNLLQRYGVPPDWGMPADAVAWFTDDESNALKVLVADYANGRRVTLRKRSRDWQIDFTRSGSAS